MEEVEAARLRPFLLLYAPECVEGESQKFRCEILDDTLLWVREDRGSLGMGDRVTTTSGAAE
jgi:hypothetical protein